MSVEVKLSLEKLCVLALAVVMLASAGCAPQILSPQEIAAERERQLKMITRIYRDVTPQDALLAADRVFRLADDDYKVIHGPMGLQAQRDWFFYAVIAFTAGTDTWSVTAEAMPSGETKVTAMHSLSRGTVTGSPVITSGGATGATTVSGPMAQNMSTTPGMYELFFSRLDYLLRKSDDWLTCKEAGRRIEDQHLDPFCTLANDRTPDGKTAVQRQKDAETTQGN